MPNIKNSFLKVLQKVGKRPPSLLQWTNLMKVLSRKERGFLIFFTFLFATSSIYLVSSFYIGNTASVPSRGGSIVEGVVGYPRFINPIYSETNDADRDLVELVFSGILGINKDGNIVPDLAETFTISEGGKLFEIDLKENIFWHDGVPVTANDVVFTIETIQDAAYKSPIRANWIGVSVQKITETSLQIRIQEPYAAFTERLTLKILPKHIWENIGSENFALSSYNLKAIGSGPYRINDIKQDGSGSVSEIRLKPNLTYYKGIAYIQSITFKFFESEKDLAQAAKRGKVTSFSLSSPELIATAAESNLTPHILNLPRYFSLFFNLKTGIGTDIDIREALTLALDKEALLKDTAKEYGRIIDSPLLPTLFSLQDPAISYSYDVEKAISILEGQGFTKQDGVLVKVASNDKITAELKKGNQGDQVRLLQECLATDPSVYSLGTVNGVFGPSTLTAVKAFQEKYKSEVLTPNGLSSATGTVGPSTREKLNEVCFSSPTDATPLAITITTVEQLEPTALSIKEQWENIGITVNIQSLQIAEFENDAIKERNYEALLFGEVLGFIPDPYPFWHSSQKRDPGLNLSLYDNSSVDSLLARARKESDKEERNRILEELQEQILEDIPAIFLYDINYVYFTSKNVKGVMPDNGLISDPSKRFAEVQNWYIKTKRNWNF